jgi:multicomponent Na+:H+ antiporter subunit F
VRQDVVFVVGVGWLAAQLVVIVVSVARARTALERLVAIDVGVLVLVGLLALVAGRDGRPYPLDAALALALLGFVSTLAAARYLGDRRPYDQPPGEARP